MYGYAWRHSAPEATLVLVHGLQSHAQWFAEAADLLVERGLAVWAVDRRGSGSSSGGRGDIVRYDEWFEEVGEVVRAARAEHPDTPVHLVGHCFGANIALGYALAHDDVRSVVMLTPGLFIRPDYSVGEKLRIATTGVLRPETLFRVPQDDELFSRSEDVVGWIAADSLGSKRLTARCLLQINRMVRRLRRHAHELEPPLLVFEAQRDRISDNERNRAFLERALPNRVRWRSYDAEHFLLAEPCRDALLDELVHWVTEDEAA